MSLPMILLPLYVQVILTLGLICFMAYHRVGSIRSGASPLHTSRSILR